MARLSVIIPTRNRSERLVRAVRSAQRQTEPDLEIVVVDDGSSDGTPGALAELASLDRRVRPVRLVATADGHGAAEARNRGLREASGELVAFLDDDDEWAPTKAQRQAAALDSRPQTAAVGCHYRVVDGSSRRPHPHIGPGRCTREQLLWCNFVGGASVVMLRRSAFEAMPSFDTSLVTCEDWDFHMACAAVSALQAVPAVLCAYTGHGDERLSRPSRLVAGRRAWLAKHRSSMSPDCLDYHEARLRIMEVSGPVAGLALAARLLTEVSPRVRRVIAAESLAARAGRLIGDPALSLRHLHRLVETG